MWVKRTQDESFEQTELRLNPIPPMIIGLLISFLLVLWVPWTFGLFVLCFALSYLGQIFFDDLLCFVSIIVSGTVTPKEVLIICNNCHKIQNKPVETSKCTCGGEYEPIEDWMWLEDDAADKEKTSKKDS